MHHIPHYAGAQDLDKVPELLSKVVTLCKSAKLILIISISELIDLAKVFPKTRIWSSSTQDKPSEKEVTEKSMEEC